MSSALTIEPGSPVIPLPQLSGIPGTLSAVEILHATGTLDRWIPPLARSARALARRIWPDHPPRSLRTRWAASTPPARIAQDLAALLERAVDRLTPGGPGWEPHVEFLPDDPTYPGSLLITVWINEPLCVYAERLAALARRAPGLAQLAAESLRLLAWIVPLHTWHDLVRDYEERIEGMADDDPEFLQESQKRLQALKETVPAAWRWVGGPPPRTTPRGLRKELDRLRRSLRQYRGGPSTAGRWAEWTARALAVVDARLTISPLPDAITEWVHGHDDDESVPLWLFLPLLWSAEDEVSTLWSEALDDYGQSGASPPALRFALIPGPVLERCLDALTNTVNTVQGLTDLLRHPP